GVRIGTLGVDGRAPARELRDVLVMLGGPTSQLRARELALRPLLGEGIHAAVAGVDGGAELLAERARLAHWRPPCVRSVDESKDHTAHAPDVLDHEALGPPGVPALERLQDAQVLAHERLHA